MAAESSSSRVVISVGWGERDLQMMLPLHRLTAASVDLPDVVVAEVVGPHERRERIRLEQCLKVVPPDE